MPPDPDLLQRLRAARQAELLGDAGQAVPGPLPLETHRVSLTRVHDDLRTVLGRIDAAEAAMRPVLQRWALDPARGGAHLLAAEGQGEDDLRETLGLQTAGLPPGPDDGQLPDTISLDKAPGVPTEPPP